MIVKEKILKFYFDMASSKKKYFKIVNGLFFFLVLFLPVLGNSLTLADNGVSEYVLILPATASKSQEFASRSFQNYFLKITGVHLPIIKEKIASKKYISIADLSEDPVYSKNDSFSIYVKDENIFLEGGKRGILYATYHFFETFAGCRFFTQDCEIVPEKKVFTISDTVKIIEKPALDWREIYCYTPSVSSNALKWRLNGNTAAYVKEKNTYWRLSPEWLTFVHSSFQFLPPEKWKSTNPEFYSRRHNDLTKLQICFSRFETIPIVVENIKKDLEKRAEEKLHPEYPFWGDSKVLYIDFSQMDCKAWCICPECIKGYIKYGSKMGTILEYVNELATYFPDYTITTLSFFYSVKPPKNIKPAKNVRIMLCNILNYRSLPINESPYSVDKQFVKYIKEWEKLTDNLFVWDYNINFSHYLLPFPNLAEVQQGNIKLMVENGVKGVFSQGSMTYGSSLEELRTYLIAKLLWNPNCDIKKEENDFIASYYGLGAPYVKNYIDRLKKEAAKYPLWIYHSPQIHIGGFLSKSNVKEYRNQISKALDVAESDVVKDRIERLELSLLYVVVMNKYETGDALNLVLKRMYDITQKNRISDFAEINSPSEDFFKKQGYRP